MPALDVSFTESFSFGVIPISFITDELLKLRKKSSPDVLGFSGSILSIAAHVIAPSLQVLFCKSLELGYVPNDWKLALVTPLYKGIGSIVLGSYRPISVISHVPKIIEKYVNLTLNNYLSKHSFLHGDQFAYVKSQSTVNALCKHCFV